MEDQDRIIKIDIDEEMRSSYIDYSMSVIVSRALPDVRDGFKPVHRRVLFGMNELGLTFNKPTKKSARIVGEVLGKYHPHGDSSVYGTLVRMAQDWTLRYPLVFGQGNFGSIDGDSAAAMRYTEAKLNRIAEDIMIDLDKDTVDFQDNFDGEHQEPTVMPTRIPQLLVNGASGIAVGMATNMAPHNISDTIDAIVAYVDNKEIDIEDLIKLIKAPDFPTGGIIYGYSGVRDSYLTGRGKVVIRAKCEIETDDSHDKIVIREIPYQINRSELISSIADMVNEKRIEGISNINDESDHEGMRIVIDVKRDANSQVVLNKLYKYSALQSSFSVNNIALVHGRPKLLNLRDLISEFVAHRMEVVTRRTMFELKEAEKRAHILEALIVAVDNLDEVIQIIRSSKTVEESRQRLMDRFNFDLEQAKAIVEMRLRQLVALAIEELRAEYADLMKLIEHLKAVLASEEMRMQIIKDELLEVKEKYGDERRTEIMFTAEEFNPEDFYADEEMVLTLSHMGYIKRTPLAEFKSQNRGGVGSKGSSARDADFIEYIYSASMHNTLLFFTQKGRCYWQKVYQLPEGAKNTKGRAIQNMLNIDSDDKINAMICVKSLDDEEFNKSHNIVFCTKNGVIKKTSLEAYSRPRTNGVNAIVIREDDRVIDVCLTDGNSEIIMANKHGKAIRFNESKVRTMGRVSTGVKGMTLDGDDDEVIGMIVIEDAEKESILVVSDQGYGKRSNIEDYRVTNRGGKGVKTLNITEKTGDLIAIKNVTDEHDLMIINKSGITIRLCMTDVRIQGRATQGVRLINLTKKNDQIASVCRVTHSEEDENESEEGVEETLSDETENNNNE
ncbi:MAG: DNA gyrase subunit A [Paludibacteraceae bacterium]|nr:DNA gyrase subunit A [Paludibacteraceae bacterium]MBR2261017.1 DNA gyrase subunit A [Paludibacteraceae bacterium]MEE3482870.1 DNA gyrase subunit A [Bacteroidales bacterium]